MDKFIINGGIRLKGEVQISGSKNAALPIMAASILSPNKNTILKVPELRDEENKKMDCSCSIVWCRQQRQRPRGYMTFKNLKTIIYMLTGKLNYR